MTRTLGGAEMKGREAYAKGAGRLENPYKDRRTERGHVTWSRGFRKAWFEGWDYAEKRRLKNPEGTPT